MTNGGDPSNTTQPGSTSPGSKPEPRPDVPEQRAGIDDDPVATGVSDFSLAALIRTWLSTSEAVERQARPEGDDSPPRPTWTPPPEVLTAVVTQSPGPGPSPVDPVAPADPADPADPAADELPAQPRPELPRRRRQPPQQAVRRLAVLIHAGTTPAESAEALFGALAEQGTVSVCRAYADWTSAQARTWWSAPLRRHGIQPYHQFGDGQDQRSLVALTIDAVDLAREGAVDAVVLVGDLVSLQPLMVRLNAAGLQVLAFGTTSTPDDVKALCHDFVDLSSGADLPSLPRGRHRLD